MANPVLQDVELGATNAHADNDINAAEPAKKESSIDQSTSDNEDDQEGEEEQITKATKSKKGIGKTIIACITMMVIYMVMLGSPAFILWNAGGYPEYSYANVKIGNPNTNYTEEFIRYSIVFMIILVLYEFICALAWSLPEFLGKIIKSLNAGKLDKHTKRRLDHLQAAHFWISLCILIPVSDIIGARLVFRNNVIETLTAGLLNTTPKTAAAVQAAVTPLRNEWFYFERTISVLIIFFVLQALGKYLLQLIKTHFNRMAFEDRVSDLNYRFQVVTKLHTALKNPGKKAIIKEKYLESKLIPDRMSELASEKRAIDLANDLFQRLVPPNRDYLTIDDFATYFNPDQLEGAFKVFDKADDGDPSRDEIKTAVMDLYRDRKGVEQGIANNERIIRKLDTMIVLVVLFFTITFGIPIFNLGASAILIIFGLVWTASGYLFQNTAKSIFESFLFVLVEHAYDVGDRVIIDGEFLTVEKVEIFTSIFRRWDGTAVYIPNSVLSNKNIFNIRRSTSQCDTIDVNLADDTSIDSIWQLKDKLAEFAKSEPKDYTGRLDFVDFSSDGGKIKVQLLVEYKTNFQDAALTASRRNKFMAMLKQVVADLDLTYFP